MVPAQLLRPPTACSHGAANASRTRDACGRTAWEAAHSGYSLARPVVRAATAA